MPASRACWSLIPPISSPFIVCMFEQYIWSSHEVPGLPMGGRADQPEPCPYGSSLLGSLRQIVLVLLALHSTFLEPVHPSLWCPSPWPQCFLGVASTSHPLMLARRRRWSRSCRGHSRISPALSLFSLFREESRFQIASPSAWVLGWEVMGHS